MSRLSVPGSIGALVTTGVVALGVAASASAQVSHAKRPPTACPSTAAMTKAAHTKITERQASKVDGGLDCSYNNGTATKVGTIYISFDVDPSYGETKSEFWAGIDGAAKEKHAKVHKFKAGEAAAWYWDGSKIAGRKDTHTTVLTSKKLVEIEDNQKSADAVSIARRFG